MSEHTNNPMFTAHEQLLIEAAAALKLARETSARDGGVPIDNSRIETGLMDLVHKMRMKRLDRNACGC